MSVWHSCAGALAVHALAELVLDHVQLARGFPSGPGAAKPLFPWQARQVSLSGFPTSFSTALRSWLGLVRGFVRSQGLPGQTTDAPARQMAPAITHVASLETRMAFDSPVKINSVPVLTAHRTAHRFQSCFGRSPRRFMPTELRLRAPIARTHIRAKAGIPQHGHCIRRGRDYAPAV